jgi:uncharacterized membrane protein
MLTKQHWLYFSLAIAGICDAIYDASEYLSQNFNSCSIKSTIFSCGGVAQSGHTSISFGQFAIPFWITGLVWFPLALILGIIAFRYFAEVLLIPFLMIGNIFTVYLWFLELDVIHLICPTCLSLYLLNYAMTAVAVWMVVSAARQSRTSVTIAETMN